MRLINGRLNKDTGNPEVMADHVVVAKGDYNGFAFYVDEDGQYMVFGSFWEGRIPSNLVGVAIELKVIGRHPATIQNELAGEAWGHMNEKERRKALHLGAKSIYHLNSPWDNLSNKDKALVVDYMQAQKGGN